MIFMRALMFVLCFVGALLVGFAVVARFADFVNLSIFGLLMAVGIILIWSGALYDIWRRADLATASRMLWTGLVLVFPLVGTLIYAIARPAAAEVTYRGEQPA